MRDREINRFEMAQTTRRVLDQYRTAWEGTPDTVDDVAALDAHLAAVRDAAQRQADPTTAVTKEKSALRSRVETGAVHLAGAMRTYALRRDRVALADRVALTTTEAGRLRDLALAERSEIVVTAAREHADDGLLARTSVTQEEIDALDALDDEFADALDTPRAAIIAKSRATAQIAEHLSAVHRLLDDRLDPEADRLADAHPDFARDYRAARVVVDRGQGRSSDDDEA